MPLHSQPLRSTQWLRTTAISNFTKFWWYKVTYYIFGVFFVVFVFFRTFFVVFGLIFHILSSICASIIFVAMWLISVSRFAIIISWLAVIISWFDFSVSCFAVRMSWVSVVFGLVGGIEGWRAAVGSGCCVWASVEYGRGRWGERIRGRFLWVGLRWRGLSRVASSLVAKGRYGRRTWVKGKKNGLR